VTAQAEAARTARRTQAVDELGRELAAAHESHTEEGLHLAAAADCLRYIEADDQGLNPAPPGSECIPADSLPRAFTDAQRRNRDVRVWQDGDWSSSVIRVEPSCANRIVSVWFQGTPAGRLLAPVEYSGDDELWIQVGGW
jgi:hypothetical protein